MAAFGSTSGDFGPVNPLADRMLRLADRNQSLAVWASYDAREIISLFHESD
jgi:hypothetical protein